MIDAQSPEQLHFDSDLLAPDERFARYRALYNGGVDASLIDGAFAVQVRGWRLDRAVLFDRRLNGVAHRRASDRAGRDGFDHFTVTVVLGGRFEVDVGDGARRIEPGQGVVLDMLQPVSNRSAHAHIRTVSMARERVAAAAAGVGDDLHGRRIGGDRAAMLADYLDALTQRLAHLDATALPPVTDALVSLIALVLGAPAGLDDAAQREARRAGQVRTIIDRHLGDAAFGMADLSRLSGLSRSTLYRVVADRGGVAGLIRERRLERLRQQLLDPDEARPFATLAYAAGFASESHASTAFLDRFGLRPGQYRVAHGLFDDVGDPGVQIRRWHDEMR